MKNTINIDYGLLGEALTTMTVDDAEHFRKVTSEDVQLPTIGFKDGVCSRIPLDENIKFIIRDMSFVAMMDKDYIKYKFDCELYIDRIKIEFYVFSLMIKDDNIWQEWILENKKVYHKMPYSIKKFINEFSAEAVEVKHKELENDEINMRREKDKTWQEEEKRLQKIFKEY